MGNNSARSERVNASDSGVPADQWRRMHPLTPLSRGAAVISAVVVFVLWQNLDTFWEIIHDEDAARFGLGLIFGLAALAVFAVALLTVLFTYIAWRREEYAVTAEAVWHRSGIIFRRQRHARLIRIQAVNIHHGLIGRLLKLGSVTIEVAGGGDSNVQLGLLKSSDLEKLRGEILRRVYEARAAEAGTNLRQGAGEAPVAKPGAQLPHAVGTVPAETGISGAGNTGSVGAFPAGSHAPVHSTDPHAHPAGPAPALAHAARSVEDLLATESQTRPPIFKVAASNLVKARLLDTSTIFTVVFFILVMGGWLSLWLVFGSAGTFASGIPVLLIAGSALVSSWKSFRDDYNFTATLTDEGVHITAGLTSTRSQTIPVQRVHAVEVTQPLLWRAAGFYRVTIAQAGVSFGDSSSAKASDVLLPVGSFEDVLRAVWLIFPDLGCPDPVEKLGAALSEFDDAAGYTKNPPQSKWFDPLTYRRKGIFLTTRAALVRNGRLTRRLTVVSLPRVQSWKVDRGPIDKRMNLASLHLDLAGGLGLTGFISHLDKHVAAQLVEQLQDLTRQAQLRDRDEEWFARAQRHLQTVSGEDIFNADFAEDAPATPAVTTGEDAASGPTQVVNISEPSAAGAPTQVVNISEPSAMRTVADIPEQDAMRTVAEPGAPSAAGPSSDPTQAGQPHPTEKDLR
ncbi:MAG: PH domain-containing protein [Actinomycetaceae bacterium]|nr:PH domain-containing protein [Actinomycetaceae bacterium]